MNKYLITGFSGFVSMHFLAMLDSLNEAIEVVGVDLKEPEFIWHSCRLYVIKY